jgi:rod shape-determining protein MreC
LERVPRDKKIEEGAIVSTSALGEVFPAGLLVGEVEKFDKSDIEPFQKVVVYPFFDIEETESVFVITSF